jgi:hypothetical protein
MPHAGEFQGNILQRLLVHFRLSGLGKGLGLP